MSDVLMKQISSLDSMVSMMEREGHRSRSRHVQWQWLHLLPPTSRSGRSKTDGWRCVDLWCDHLWACVFWIRKGGNMPTTYGMRLVVSSCWYSTDHFENWLTWIGCFVLIWLLITCTQDMRCTLAYYPVHPPRFDQSKASRYCFFKSTRAWRKIFGCSFKNISLDRFVNISDFCFSTVLPIFLWIDLIPLGNRLLTSRSVLLARLNQIVMVLWCAPSTRLVTVCSQCWTFVNAERCPMMPQRKLVLVLIRYSLVVLNKDIKYNWH